MRSPMKNKLIIAGSGLAAADASRALIACMDASAQLFCIEPLSRFAAHFPAHAHKCISLDEVFDVAGDQRSRALRLIAERIIEACRAQAASALILGGHPCLAVKPVQHLLELQPDWLDIDILPGVSSLDWMMADLGLDIADTGLQIITGGRSEALSSALPAAILAPGYAQTVQHADRLLALAVLARNLIACYGAQAQFLVYHRHASGFVARACLADALVALANERRLGDKLLIGPLSLLPARIARQVQRPALDGLNGVLS
jgi:hypothetical protein